MYIYITHIHVVICTYIHIFAPALIFPPRGLPTYQECKKQLCQTTQNVKFVKHVKNVKKVKMIKKVKKVKKVNIVKHVKKV